MEAIHELLAKGFSTGQEILTDKNVTFLKVEKSLDAYLTRAKDTLQKKHLINPKPVKRLMRVIQDENEDEEEPRVEQMSIQATSPEKSNESIKELRPVRTAKAKAVANLKEVALNTKMRNDQNTVTIKTERTSSTSSRDSIKENKIPDKDIVNSKRRSPDEGIQSANESETASSKSCKRSNSVELISDKLVAIDITDDHETMPPPAAVLPKKVTKKTRTKQKVEEQESQPLRVTRSKIKQEKLSVLAPPPAETETASSTTLQNESKIDESVKSKKPKKKYPLPLLINIKMEKSNNDLQKNSKDVIVSDIDSNNTPKADEIEAEAASAPQTCNDTYRVEPTVDETVTITPAVNETITIAQAALNETMTIASNVIPNGDTTVTLSKNVHDSLMTSDNDDEDYEGNSMQDDVPPPLPPKLQPFAPTMKLKKNEVFNPYLSSPVKQKVQAFEKHAGFGTTPDKFNTLPAKFNPFKNGTPSKIVLYGKATTPLNKHPKITSTSSGTFLTVSAPGHHVKKPAKMYSLSQESLDETRRNQANTLTQLLEEKRKNREEKMRQAQLQREANEKEKREQVLKLQQERDEKYRKIMREKEEKQRMEAMKKKILKEKQSKKYAEEKSRKDEFAVPKPVEPQGALIKNDSLHKKLQKSIISTKKKTEMANVYSFDMLNTDDETDDESRPSDKRPPIPDWSYKKVRKPLMQTQSFVAPAVLDVFFGTAPISVDLRAIFPSIEAKKLIRNSSAIWRTPPKHY